MKNGAGARVFSHVALRIQSIREIREIRGQNHFKGRHAGALQNPSQNPMLLIVGTAIRNKSSHAA
jgi:hypothetical protein